MFFKTVGFGVVFNVCAVKEGGGEVLALWEEPGGEGDDAGLVVVEGGEDPGVGFASENS